MDSYHEWIRLVAAFTVHSLESWQWAAASVYYLLGLWSRLVSSLPYLKGEAPSLLETYVPKITQAYLTSRRGPSHAGPSKGLLWSYRWADGWKQCQHQVVGCQ